MDQALNYLYIEILPFLFFNGSHFPGIVLSIKINISSLVFIFRDVF